jgi:hypothetical protein
MDCRIMGKCGTCIGACTGLVVVVLRCCAVGGPVGGGHSVAGGQRPWPAGKLFGIACERGGVCVFVTAGVPSCVAMCCRLGSCR